MGVVPELRARELSDRRYARVREAQCSRPRGNTQVLYREPARGAGQFLRAGHTARRSEARQLLHWDQRVYHGEKDLPVEGLALLRVVAHQDDECLPVGLSERQEARATGSIEGRVK